MVPTAAPAPARATTRAPERTPGGLPPGDPTDRAASPRRGIPEPAPTDGRGRDRTSTEAGARRPSSAGTIGRRRRGRPTGRRERPPASRVRTKAPWRAGAARAAGPWPSARAVTSTRAATETCTAGRTATGRRTTAETGTMSILLRGTALHDHGLDDVAQHHGFFDLRTARARSLDARRGLAANERLQLLPKAEAAGRRGATARAAAALAAAAAVGGGSVRETVFLSLTILVVLRVLYR